MKMIINNKKVLKVSQDKSGLAGFSYVHSLMSYEDLRATINPNTNRRSRKIKQYSKHLYNCN